MKFTELTVPTILRGGAKKVGLSQKQLSMEANIGRGTISNYLKDGYSVPTDEILKLAEVINDDETKANIAFTLLGTLPMFNGNKIKNSADAYANFMEDEELEERRYLEKKRIKSKLSSEYLDDQEKHEVRHWSRELLDEILMEYGVLMRASEASDTSIEELLHERMPEYVTKGYLKGAGDYEKSRSRNY